MPQYVVKRNKKDTHVVFGKAARSVPPEAIGSIQARMSSSGHASKIDIVQTDRTEEEGSEYLVLYNIPFGDFRTRTWNEARTSLGGKVSYGSTTATINALNTIIEIQASDLDTGSGGIGTEGSINTTGIITATTGSFTNLTGTLSGVSTNFVSAVGIQSAGTVIGAGITQLNFVGLGNTFKVSGTTVDVSISGNTGAGGTWSAYTAGIATTKSVGVNTSNLDDPKVVGTANSFQGIYVSNGMYIHDNTLNGNHYIGTAYNGLMAGPVTINGVLTIDGNYVVV